MLTTIYARLYWTLVASFCVMGLSLAFALPIFAVPDEPAHWLSAHFRMERWLGSDGCVPILPGNPCPRRRTCSSIPRLELSCAGDLDLYGDLMAYPGVLLSKLILPRQTESGIRQVQAIIVSRLLQGLLIAICLLRVGLLALRGRHSGLLCLAAFMLSPLLAQQSFSVSSDGVQLAFGLCLFSAIMFWERLGWLDLALFVLLGWGAAAKPTVLVCILPSVLAGFWFGQLRTQVGSSPLAIARALVAALRPRRVPSLQTLLLWSALALCALTVFYSLQHDAKNYVTPDPSADANRIGQIAALRASPLLIFKLVAALRYSPTEASSWVGPLGWLDLSVSAAVTNAFLRILVFALLAELAYFVWIYRSAGGALAGSWQRLTRAWPALLLGLLGPLVNLLFVTAVMFVLWTPVGSPVPHGVQIRYFFPTVMVLIAVLWRTLSEVFLPSAEQVAISSSAGNAEAGRVGPARLWMQAAGVLAPCLVLALSLPLVARVYIDVANRYHDPARYRN